MSSFYYPMPGMRVPGPLNFEPVTNALMHLSQTRQRQEQFERDDKRLALEDQRWRTTDARSQQQFDLQKRKAELEEQGLPQERALRQAQIDLAQAQARSAGQKNVLESAVADLITGGANVSNAPPPHSTPGSSNLQGGPNPGVQPQSYGGERAPSRNFLMDTVYSGGQAPPAGHNALMPSQTQQTQQYRPGVILAADDMPYGRQAPPAPQQRPGGPPVAQPGEDMVETPLGTMSRARARQLGMGLALAGKGDAGRMLADSATPGANLQKPTLNQIEERTVNSAMQLGRLADIKKRFDPKFLEIPQRMKLLGQSWSAKMGGKLSPDQAKEMNRYAAFRSSTVNNANQILKELSGAAVTPQEYERIQNDIPIAGTGIFDGDDPVSFVAKYERSEQSLRSAIARYNFMRSQGLNFTKENIDMFMGLDDVPAAYEKRGDEIEATIRQRNPSITPQALEEQTAVQLKREWGI
jgi:hypothetical protein